jgi:hypothetical protein
MRKGEKLEGIRVKDTPRSSDEMILNMIHFKKMGWPWSRIIKRFGKGGAQELCANVLKDDIAYSGEPEEEVRKAYW